MQLVFSEGYFEARGYNKKIPGFIYDEDTKLWKTVDAQLAKSYLHYADQDTQLEIYKQEAELKTSIAQSRAEVCDIIVPSPARLKYDSYQLPVVAFAAKRKRILLADEQGIGKTVSAIGVVNYSLARKEYIAPRGLIICQSHLKLHWLKHLSKWLIDEHGIAIADSKSFPRYSQFVVVHYDALDKWYDEMRYRPWEYLIVDECQHLCNPKANRTRMVFGNPDLGIEPIQSDRAILLSGTPFNNRPIELYSILHYLDPDRWNSRIDYGIKYCDGKKNEKTGKYNFKGASHLAELQGKMRSTIMIRRLKVDVMKDLPPKRRQVIELPPGDDLLAFIKEELDAWDSYNSKIYEARKKVESAKELNHIDEYKEAMESLRYTEKIRFEKISEFRKKTGIATLPFVLTHLEDIMQDGRKIVVFGHHHEVVEAIFNKFKDANPLIIYGGNLQEFEGAKAEELFQTDSSRQLFICSLRMATGLTLTASSHEVFAELDWTASVIKQAEDRCHRRGTKDAILIQYLVLARSLAARMAHKIIEKLEYQEKVLDKDEILEELPEVVL